jgi:glycosyltransferase involved in cell wall biosynthesis
MKMPESSICLTIHNQQDIIEAVLNGILNNASQYVKEMIVVLDGCTDASASIVEKTLNKCKMKTVLYPLDNVFETRANNSTFRVATSNYIITVQDDMVIEEKDFDLRLLKPFAYHDMLLGVTARNAQNELLVGNGIQCLDVAGKDVNTPRDILAIRNVIVRGPIAFDHAKIEDMGYLDEEFAPMDSDDKDLCYRSYKKHGWLVGSYAMNYKSELQWGKTRNNPISNQVWAASAIKNIELLKKRHSDMMVKSAHVVQNLTVK